MSEQRKINIRLFLKVFGVIGAFVTTAIVAGMLYVTSQTGQQKFLNWTADYLSDEYTTVKFGALDGSLFSDFGLSSVTVSDGRGVWFSAQNLKVSWSSWGLLSRRVDIQDMTIGSLRLQRLPKGQPAADKPVLSLALPTLPVDINIAHFDVRLFEFGRDIYTAQDKFHIDGSLKLVADDEAVLKADMTSLSKSRDQVSVYLAHSLRGE